MEKNIQLGEYIKRVIALGSTIMVIGSHGMPAKAESCNECSKINYTVEQNIRPEYKDAFIDIINNKYNGSLTNENFTYGYMALNQYVRSGQVNAKVKILNGEEVAISDFPNYSIYCDDETDEKINYSMIERMVNLYNETFRRGKHSNIDETIELVNEFMKFIEDNKASLTPGGIWLLKNSGYVFLKEYINVYTEECIKDRNFAKIWFTYFDIDIYNKTNKFELKEGLSIDDTLNNGDCLTSEKALIDTFLDITNRLREANREIPILIPCDNTARVFYDENNSKLLAKVRKA